MSEHRRCAKTLHPLQTDIGIWEDDVFSAGFIEGPGVCGHMQGYPLTPILVRGVSEGVARENAGAISITQTSIEMTNQTAQFH